MENESPKKPIEKIGLDTGVYIPKIHGFVVQEEMNIQHSILEESRYNLKQTLLNLMCEENLFKRLKERVKDGEIDTEDNSISDDIQELIEHVRKDPNIFDEIIKVEPASRNEEIVKPEKRKRGRPRKEKGGEEKKKVVKGSKRKRKTRKSEISLNGRRSDISLNGRKSDISLDGRKKRKKNPQKEKESKKKDSREKKERKKKKEKEPKKKRKRRKKKEKDPIPPVPGDSERIKLGEDDLVKPPYPEKIPIEATNFDDDEFDKIMENIIRNNE